MSSPSFGAHPADGPGQVVHIGPERLAHAGARMEQAVAAAARSGDHVWIVIPTHLVTDPDLIGDGMLLDQESIVFVEVGCYVCEQPYKPLLKRRRCPGEPR